MFNWYCAHWTMTSNWEKKKKTKVITYYILGQMYYILRYFGFLHFASKVITFWVIEVITYILRRKLLHFGLLLHFASKVITFCVTITFWVNCYILWRSIPAFDQSVSLISRANSVSFTYFYRALPVNKCPRNSLARTYQFGVLDNKSLIRRFVV